MIRLNLLRIVRSICDSNDERGGLLRKYGLYDAVQKLADSDSAVLVRNMASELVKSALEWDQQYHSAGRRRRSRRASSSTSSIMTGGSPFPPSTPLGRPSLSTSYFDVQERRPQSGMNGSKLPFRPTSRDGLVEKASLHLTGANNVGKSRLPRTTSTHRIARLSFGAGPEKPENRAPATPALSRLPSTRRQAMIGVSR